MKGALSLALRLIVVGGVTVFAQTQNSPFPEKKVHEAGLDISYFTYNEPSVKTEGMMYGLAGSPARIMTT